MTDKAVLDSIVYLVGDRNIICSMKDAVSRTPFSDEVVDFLSDLSGIIMAEGKKYSYPDVVTFGFWIRRSALAKMKERYSYNGRYLGRGTVFHVAPSNVPVNFAYSLAAGLLTGNANIVRISEKDFEQVKIIARAIKVALEKHVDMQPYIALVRYGHDKIVNDLLSGICDTRIIWGGDATIATFRESPLPPRSTEVVFADRFSMAVIDSDVYMERADKDAIAEGFYNDTYLTDQNACTSPRLVVWHGKETKKAKTIFWKRLHNIVREKYNFQGIQAVKKLGAEYMAMIALCDVQRIAAEDNLITRVQISELDKRVVDLLENSGFFFEYDCNDSTELWDICNNTRCQTVSVIGDESWLLPLIEKGVKGIDRIVPIGHTMDFDLIWDGYDLSRLLTRMISII